jgi:hypothetical protein
MLQFRDSHSIAPEQFFNTRCLVIAVFEADDLGRRTSFFGNPQKVGISRHYDQTVATGKRPDRFVRRKPTERQVEDMSRIGKKFGEAANQFGR